MDTEKASFHRSKIENANTKELFRVVDDISGTKKSASDILPNNYVLSELPASFAKFFEHKIVDIRAKLQTDSPLIIEPLSCQNSLSILEPLCLDDVISIVSKMPSKTCQLDPIPTQLVKASIDELAPFLLRIVNSSFSSGVFPKDCKTAIVRPLIKKSGLDCNIMKNYRPVSNCSFLDKFLEKCAFLRLNQYLSENSLYGRFQSAYREGHSTETALIRMLNDVMLALDKHHHVIVVLLDLSAAFDTIDHNILLDRLRSRFGIQGIALNWFDSFLKGRTQQVSVKSMMSDKCKLKYGVPQGSVLGPVLFSLYMTPIEDIITRHDLNSVIYADDSGLYIACDILACSTIVARIETCVDEIRNWMMSNMLALNDGKTEVVWFTPCTVDSQFSSMNIRVGEAMISPSNVVRDLGVMLDSFGLMDEHIRYVCRGASHSLWRISKIRKLLDQSSAEKLVHAFVTSKLDYCNSLLFGLPAYKLSKLQHIQNSAARLVTGRKRGRHIDMTSLLNDLHWLPIDERVRFKILCQIFKIVNQSEIAPKYLSELITIDRPIHNTRRSVGVRLNPFSVKHHGKQLSKTYGDRAFSVYAPKLWNSLPVDLRMIESFNLFKKSLKTFIFRQCYS